MSNRGELIYENYKATIEDLESYIEELQEKHGNLVSAIDAAKEYASIDEDRSGLAPITDGIFVRATFHADQDFVINAGEGVLVDKSAEEVVSLLEERINDVETAIEQAQDELISIYDEVDAL